MTTQKSSTEQQEQKKQPAEKGPSAKEAPRQPGQPSGTPKPESSSEYEGAPSRKPTGNEPVEVKTETSSSSGQ
jgi:hypothetical protein